MAAWGALAAPTGLSGRCADFRTHADAQAAYRAGARQLDGDGDGIACEALQ